MEAVQTFMSTLSFVPLILVPLVLAVFSMVSAYVFKFGLPKTGIYFDYVLFTLVLIAAMLVGGAI